MLARFRKYILTGIIILAIWRFSPLYTDSSSEPLNQIKVPTLNTEKFSETYPQPKEDKILASPYRDVASQKTPLSLADLQKIVTNDALCAADGSYQIQNELFADPNHRTKLIFQALTATHPSSKESDKCLLAMITNNAEEAIELTEDSSELACRFLHALFLTDQFTPTSFYQFSEVHEGIQILDQLKREHPKNGIYSLFKIGAFHRERMYEDLDKEISDFLQVRKFENPLLPLMIRIRGLGELNATAFALASEVYSTFGIPDYSNAFIALKEKTTDSKSEVFYKWLNQQSSHIQNIKQAQLAEPFVSILELSLVRSLAKSFYGASKNETSMPELFSESEWIPFFRQAVGLNDWPMNNAVGIESCPSALSSIRKNFRSYMETFKARKQIFESKK